MSYVAIASVQSIEVGCLVENEDVFEAAPTGDAKTMFEWSTIFLFIKVRLYWRFDGSADIRFEWQRGKTFI